MRAKKRLLLSSLTTLIAAALVVVGTGGAAETSMTVPYSSFNDCNGELVQLIGKMKFDFRESTDANGNHFHTTLHFTGLDGFGSTGARYVGVDVTNESSNFDSDFLPFEFTVTRTWHLTRFGPEGMPDDFRFHLVAHMTINANGVPTADHSDTRIECK
jgi:opacity protein-like surface antigen